MGITVDVLIAIFAILLTISLAAERFVEITKPLILKVSLGWQASLKITIAVLVGFGLSALFRFDMLKELSISGSLPVVGWALGGLIASTGSTVINRILDWLKTLKSNTTSSVTTSVSEGNVITEETTITKGTEVITR